MGVGGEGGGEGGFKEHVYRSSHVKRMSLQTLMLCVHYKRSQKYLNFFAKRKFIYTKRLYK
jgi:hypothetical protein